MAHYSGIAPPFTSEQISLTSPTQIWTEGERESLLRDGLDINPGEAAATIGSLVTVGSFTSADEYHGGILPSSYGKDQIFEKIWLVPSEIDAGFITEDSIHDVVIWNSFQNDDAMITSVSTVNPEGTELVYPDLPFLIRASGELAMTLTVLLLGPPLQDTYYRFVIDGISYPIYIQGIRIISLWPGPDWASEAGIGYQFHTVLYETERFVEQRRPLRDVPVRTASVKYLLTTVDAQKFFMRAAYGHDKIFAVPIYNEMMRIDSITVGSPTVTLKSTTPTTNLYNLNNLVTHCAVIDHENAQTEIKEISSIGTTSITFINDIEDTFDPNTAVVYPVFFGMIQAATFASETDAVDSVDVSFQEFVRGG